MRHACSRRVVRGPGPLGRASRHPRRPRALTPGSSAAFTRGSWGPRAVSVLLYVSSARAALPGTRPQTPVGLCARVSLGDRTSRPDETHLPCACHAPKAQGPAGGHRAASWVPPLGACLPVHPHPLPSSPRFVGMQLTRVLFPTVPPGGRGQGPWSVSSIVSPEGLTPCHTYKWEGLCVPEARRASGACRPADVVTAVSPSACCSLEQSCHDNALPLGTVETRVGRGGSVPAAPARSRCQAGRGPGPRGHAHAALRSSPSSERGKGLVHEGKAQPGCSGEALGVSRAPCPTSHVTGWRALQAQGPAPWVPSGRRGGGRLISALVTLRLPAGLSGTLPAAGSPASPCPVSLSLCPASLSATPRRGAARLAGT